MSATATHSSRAALLQELRHLRDELRRRGIVDAVEQVAGTVMAGTVERVLNAKEGFWLTAGAALALWEISGGVRVTMRALDRIYGEDRSRPGLERLGVSIGLSFPLAGFLLGALASAQVLPPALDRRLGWGVAGALGGRLIGWGVAAFLLAGAVGLLVRFAPSSRQPFQLVGAASLFVVLAWAAVSASFGLYVTHIASYGSVFAGLTFVIVLLTYVYLSSITFLAGVQVDAYLRLLARERA